MAPNDNSEIQNSAPEFSHEVEVDKVPSLGRMFKLTASPEERAALATRLDLLEFDEFRAEMKVKPLGRSSIIRVEGKIIAKLAQPCVVSLRPVPAIIEEEFELDFAPETDSDVVEREFVLSEENDYEPLEGGIIDVAEVATQHLSLCLDLYPRADSADIYEVQKDAEASGRKFEVNGDKLNPFAALSKLKDQKK
ncbi:YceD family protein [Curvivirga aplysinae]|uniref:YceD family protein n=1 Tax=Curvivirga aplysinae TaxID=2529852 RepID=UPI0012BB92D1|nr:DUF177 domain-containing protein [Curvivirga aplysinae]MTI09629.1 DUF177 domain-containing protein [Curvivirga aplysinae]